MMGRVLASNAFYRAKLEPLGYDAARPPRADDLESLPYTTKQELVVDAARHPPFGSNLTYSLDRYVRIHQTSGTTGDPLRWFDTPESWAWWLGCWQAVYDAAGVTMSDRVFVAFSFGPFIGFWAGFEAVQQRGALAIPGGGLSTRQRVGALRDLAATVLVCTPTYAFRLAQAAREVGWDAAASPIRLLVLAGEPGASVANTRRALEEAWGAQCVDHVGATEVGAWGFSCGTAGHVHVNEDEFIVELRTETASNQRTEVERGELVLTNLGRIGSPVIRYRTGDHVELVRSGCPCGSPFAYVRGGVLGRVDDMVVVRGVNVFPSAVENVVRESKSVQEFEVLVHRDRGMAELTLRVELDADNQSEAQALAQRVHDRLGLRAQVEIVPPGQLPRYELKARRFKVE
jgi:phenylacetate-CoA ligase